MPASAARIRIGSAASKKVELRVERISNPSLVACHECDLLQRETELPLGGKAVCARCGATLYVRRRDTIDHTLALVLAAAVLFIIGNAFPVVTMEIQGQRTEALVLQGAWRIYQEGQPLVGGIVFLTAFVFPLVQIVGMLAILLPLRLGSMPRYLVPAFRTVEECAPWSMVEVFMLGVLVSLVKLAHMATVVPGVGMWAFFALIIVLASASTVLDPREVWDRLDAAARNAAGLGGCREGSTA